MRHLESISPHSASADGYNDRRMLSAGIRFQPTEADSIKLNCSTSLAGSVVGAARRFPGYRPCEIPCDSHGMSRKLARPKRFELLTPRFVVCCLPLPGRSWLCKNALA